MNFGESFLKKLSLINEIDFLQVRGSFTSAYLQQLEENTRPFNTMWMQVIQEHLEVHSSLVILLRVSYYLSTWLKSILFLF